MGQRAKTSAIQARSRKLSVCNALWLFSQVVQRSMYSGLVLSELFSTCFSVQQNLPEANWLAAFSALLQTDPLSSQLVSLCNETWTFLLCGVQQTPLMRILCLVANGSSQLNERLPLSTSLSRQLLELVQSLGESFRLGLI